MKILMWPLFFLIVINQHHSFLLTPINKQSLPIDYSIKDNYLI